MVILALVLRHSIENRVICLLWFMELDSDLEKVANPSFLYPFSYLRAHASYQLKSNLSTLLMDQSHPFLTASGLLWGSTELRYCYFTFTIDRLTIRCTSQLTDTLTFWPSLWLSDRQNHRPTDRPTDHSRTVRSTDWPSHLMKQGINKQKKEFGKNGRLSCRPNCQPYWFTDRPTNFVTEQTNKVIILAYELHLSLFRRLCSGASVKWKG